MSFVATSENEGTNLPFGLFHHLPSGAVVNLDSQIEGECSLILSSWEGGYNLQCQNLASAGEADIRIQFLLTIIHTLSAAVKPCGFPFGCLMFQSSYMATLVILFINFYIKAADSVNAQQQFPLSALRVAL
ncbi:Elongation of very long chain fatty acids protein 2 [Chelonia mydas]|uniref:Elongation of very long chain fatty acids protein 2 n=1 Tax=Chelonia mydas TaxID=8469 RepID=M7B7Y0_CHEMY|nr:Elongation of very long chain fatty acids protein 2 [Chelonia mydas]